MGYIESSKIYTGTDLETVFFRPMLTGASAQELGVRVLYNMPVPTSIQLYTAQNNLLRSHTTTGWDATSTSTKSYKTIDMKRVKAEMGFSASDYYNIVFEDLATQSDINLNDLTGTELEKVETELFRKSLAESLRATMWIGNTSASSYNTFDGFLTKILAATRATTNRLISLSYTDSDTESASFAYTLLDRLWGAATDPVKDSKGDGELVYFVSSDIYNLYEKALDAAGVDSSYVDKVNGRQGLMYHGIPIIDAHIGTYLNSLNIMESFAMLVDRRNFVMAVNTSDFPGSEIRMWYNPDEMENRQRATFAVGCEIIDMQNVAFAQWVEEE